jgi:hypothetical protein
MSAIFSYTAINEQEFLKIAKALKPVRIPIEQSPSWGNFDNALPDRQFLGTFRYDEGDRLIAIASATLYRQKGRNWIWIKHGPLYAHVPNTATIKKMCSTLKQQFSSVKNVSPLFVRLSSPSQISDLKIPFEHTMYDQTVIVDLTKTEEVLFAEMSQSARQGIRKAEKAGVTIEEIPPQQFNTFGKELYPILSETASRSGFGVHGATLYQTMLEHLQPHVRLFVALVDKKPVAWAITSEFDDRALYYYGASNSQARDTHAPYLLHWHIIKAMKSRGIKEYDLMGIAGKNYPSLANVSTFKLKFSKNIVEIPEAYDLPLNGLKYTLLATAIKTKRKLS